MTDGEAADLVCDISFNGFSDAIEIRELIALMET